MATNEEIVERVLKLEFLIPIVTEQLEKLVATTDSVTYLKTEAKNSKEFRANVMDKVKEEIKIELGSNAFVEDMEVLIEKRVKALLDTEVMRTSLETVDDKRFKELFEKEQLKMFWRLLGVIGSIVMVAVTVWVKGVL